MYVNNFSQRFICDVYSWFAPHLKHPGTENAWEWDISMSLHEANRPFPPIHVHMDPIDHVPKWAWLQVAVTSQAILMRQKMTL